MEDEAEEFVQRLDRLRRDAPEDGFTVARVGDKIAFIIGSKREELGETAIMDADTAYALVGAMEELVDEIMMEGR